MRQAALAVGVYSRLLSQSRFGLRGIRQHAAAATDAMIVDVDAASGPSFLLLACPDIEQAQHWELSEHSATSLLRVTQWSRW